MNRTSIRDQHRLRTVYIYNLCIVLLTAVAWTVMVFFGGEGTLSTLGLANMKYFTVLSNLFEGLTALLLAAVLRAVGAGRWEQVPRWLFLMKFCAAAAVGVTFFVVLLFFVPLYGIPGMYSGGNFFFHLTIPLLSLGEFVFLDRFRRVTLRETLLAPLPALIYGCVYAVNVVVNGPGAPPHLNDFYAFTYWGLPAGFAIFAAILLLSWIIGLLLRLGNAAHRPRRPRR